MTKGTITRPYRGDSAVEGTQMMRNKSTGYGGGQGIGMHQQKYYYDHNSTMELEEENFNQ